AEHGAGYGDGLKYTAREHDADTALQFTRGRWYGPADGRWASEDPIGFRAGDANLYRYVTNDPANHTDPTGLYAKAANISMLMTPTVQGETPTKGWFETGTISGSIGTGFLELPRIGLDLGQAVIQGGNWIAGRPYLYEPASQTFKGMDDATKAGKAGEYVLGAMGSSVLNGLSFGGWSVYTGIVDWAVVGDSDGFWQTVGGGLWIPVFAAGSKLIGGGKKGASKGPQCFPAGTLVHTAAGTRAIEAVRAGDQVWAYDHRGSRWVHREVVEVYELTHQGLMATLRVKGETVRATGGHPFWVVRGEGLENRPSPVRISANEPGSLLEGRWVLARDLRPADELLLRLGEVLPLESVRLDDVEETIYNFHVAELQNYAVGECGVLVHNTSETTQQRPFIEGMDDADAARYRDYWGGDHDTSGGQPFGMKTTVTKKGELKAVTTYDEHGRPHRQYGLREGEPPHEHGFTYPTNSQPGTGWTPIRGPQQPIGSNE
ncbi:MAG: RHS repeat-associated core domain-containing protein, partial [Fimbriiglobus sp.]